MCETKDRKPFPSLPYSVKVMDHRKAADANIVNNQIEILKTVARPEFYSLFPLFDVSIVCREESFTESN